jgi:hypothetical protein
MTNFNDPDYVKLLLKDLNRIRLLLKANFHSQTVVDGMELICGAGFNLEKAESAAIGSPGFLTRSTRLSTHASEMNQLPLTPVMAAARTRMVRAWEGHLLPADTALQQQAVRPTASGEGPLKRRHAISSLSDNPRGRGASGGSGGGGGHRGWPARGRWY